MGALTDILKTHLIAYERVDGTGERIDNIASAEAAINQYISEIIGSDELILRRVNKNKPVTDRHNVGWSITKKIRNKLRAEQRVRAGITAKGDV